MIWITRWLCDKSHTSVGLAWDDLIMTPEQAEEQGESIYKKGIVNHWCGICHGELHIVHTRTIFRTIEEARPALFLLESFDLKTKPFLENRN